MDATKSVQKTVPASLIEAIRQGDHTSYDQIFMQFYARTMNFVRSLVKCKEDAEDIVEDIFVALWTNRERLDPDKNFNAYLYTVARNAVLNYFRSEKVKNTYLRHSPSEEASPASDEDFIAMETELLIKLTVEQMPAQRKKVFILSRNEGLDNDQIAGQLGISRKAVEKQLRLALSDIRKVLTMFIALLYW